MARNVRQRMDAKGLSQPDVERLSGLAVGQSTVSRLVTGDGSARLDTIAVVAGVLGCQPWELLVDDNATREAAYKKILKD